MQRTIWFSLLLCVGLALGSVPSRAQTVRLPKVGDPAFSVNVPPGWTYTYDDLGNLQFLASDHSTGLQLSMLTDPAATTSLSEDAANVFKGAGAQPYTKSEPSTLVGRPGQAFYGVLLVNNVPLQMKVILAKIDDSHVGIMVILTQNDDTPEQIAALNALISLVQLSGPQ